MTVILLALRLFYNLLVALILIRAFGSWFIRNPYSSKWYSLVIQMTEPVLAPCRNLISRFTRGIPGVDFSPVLALMLLSLIYKILSRFIYIIMH
ncbi:MAG: YggT family protein [Bacillota bacterium]|nr:YggT family protein [Bacillota bacterium]